MNCQANHSKFWDFNKRVYTIESIFIFNWHEIHQKFFNCGSYQLKLIKFHKVFAEIFPMFLAHILLLKTLD